MCDGRKVVMYKNFVEENMTDIRIIYYYYFRNIRIDGIINASVKYLFTSRLKFDL